MICCRPVPWLLRAVILALRSTVRLLYTATWKKQKLMGPAVNSSHDTLCSSVCLPVTTPGSISRKGTMRAEV